MIKLHAQRTTLENLLPGDLFVMEDKGLSDGFSPLGRIGIPVTIRNSSPVPMNHRGVECFRVVVDVDPDFDSLTTKTCEAVPMASVAEHAADAECDWPPAREVVDQASALREMVKEGAR